ncbi:MAG: LysR substrate-binding domain-containing protein, partial [Rhodospirillales bacterium]
AFAVYAARGRAPKGRGPKALTSRPWLMFDDSLSHLAAAKWLAREQGDAVVALRSNNLLTLMTGAVQGMGLALLPCFMADPETALERVTGPVTEAQTALWLLTHTDLRNTQRVRAFMDHMGDALAAQRGLLEGRG